MSLTTSIITHNMWNIAKNLSYKEIPVMESVCKSWQTILRSDYVIKKLIQEIFPKYNVLPNNPLSLQYRKLQFVPLNIARGVFRMSEMKIGAETVFEGKAHRVSLEFNKMYLVENKTNEKCPGYLLYSNFDIQFTPDESKMVTANGTVVQVRDPSIRYTFVRLIGHNETVQGFRIHSNGKNAVSISEEKVITWDLETGESLNTYDITFSFKKFEILPDRGLVFFIPASGNGLEQHSIDSGFHHVDMDEEISTMVSTPDQKMLFVSNGWRIDVMKVDTMEVLRSIPFPYGIGRSELAPIDDMRFTTYGTELFLRTNKLSSNAVVLNFLDHSKEG